MIRVYFFYEKFQKTILRLEGKRNWNLWIIDPPVSTERDPVKYSIKWKCIRPLIFHQEKIIRTFLSGT